MIHVACKGCGAFDVVGPGHPATRFNRESGRHELFDRSALKHTHAEDCLPDEEGNRPLHFTFMASVGVS